MSSFQRPNSALQRITPTAQPEIEMQTINTNEGATELLFIAVPLLDNNAVLDSIKYNIFNPSNHLTKSFLGDITNIKLHQINLDEFTPIIVPGSKSVPKTPRPMETPRPTSARPTTTPRPTDMANSASAPIIPTSTTKRTVESLRRRTVLPTLPPTSGGKTLKQRRQRKRNKTRTTRK